MLIRTLLLFAGLVAVGTAAGQEPLKIARRFTVDKPGWSYEEKPRPDDPVLPLTPEEAARLEGGVTEAACAALLEGYLDRIEETWTRLHTPPPELIPWLRKNPDLRRAFWQALNPHYDNISGAMRLLDQLRSEDGGRAAAAFHVAVALSVVWDDPDAVHGSRYYCVGGVEAAQYPPLMEPLQVFRFFTSPENQKLFVFRPDKLVWPILVHLVDFDVTTEEASWAAAKMFRYARNPEPLYALVAYDYDKRDKGSKLGARPYTLPNLLEYGGICGDQAHFCTRVAKCFGIPAMKADGLGRYGDDRHAFACYFVCRDGRPMLEFAGRYYYDFYYSGEVFDPHTRTFELDRTVAMMLDGASLDYGKYAQSLTLARIARRLVAENPRLSCKLAEQALVWNYFCTPAWKLLILHLDRGTLSPEAAASWMNTMVKCLGNHPDLSMECLSSFLRTIPEGETRKRQEFYGKVMKLYAKRPDLQVELRQRQCGELLKAGQEDEAMRLLLATLAEHGPEGRLLVPLIEETVPLVQRKKAEKTALPFLRRMVEKFPQARGQMITLTFQNVVRIIGPIYDAAGEKQEADLLRKRVGLK